MSDEGIDGIIDLTRALVETPSQGGIDADGAIMDVLRDWLDQSGLTWRFVERGSRRVGVLISVESGQPGPHVCLDAPVDTAPVGRIDAWEYPPFGAVESNGRLYGRGVADCKIAASMFCHLARDARDAGLVKTGALDVLLEADEHTGDFGCVRSAIEEGERRWDFVAIGYPGNYGVIVGARGFYRARVRMFGEEGHSGSKRVLTGCAAISKSARFVSEMGRIQFPREFDPDFEFGAKVSVTAIHGGDGFSQIPGVVEVNIDFRLTPACGVVTARELLLGAVNRTDHDMPSQTPSEIEELESWPPYRLEEGNPFAKALRASGEKELGRAVPPVVCGPSNVGNLLAAYGIPATCGFGVDYRNIHAPNEYIEIASVSKIYSCYRRAVQTWLSIVD